MILSSEQMRVVEAGSPGTASFEWVDVPVGPQPMPPWAKGLEIRWMDGYGNPPCYTVKTDRSLQMWPDQVFRFDGRRYISESGDGRVRCFYAGEPFIDDLKQGMVCFPASPPDAPGEYRYDRTGKWFCSEMKPTGKRWWSHYRGWATPQGEGYGGWSFHIKLDDGRWVMLRGPWHGPEPEGYIDVAGRGHGSSRASGAGAISHEALILLIARYRPECRVARVTIRGRTSIEAVRPDWDEPKSIMLERGRI